MNYPDNTFDCPYCGMKVAGFDMIIKHYETAHPAHKMKFQDYFTRKVYVLSEYQKSPAKSQSSPSQRCKLLNSPSSASSPPKFHNDLNHRAARPSVSSSLLSKMPFYKINVTCDRGALTRKRMLQECAAFNVKLVKLKSSQDLIELAALHDLKRIDGREVQTAQATTTTETSVPETTSIMEISERMDENSSNKTVTSQSSPLINDFLARVGLKPNERKRSITDDFNEENVVRVQTRDGNILY